ncbi:MAG: hypothetical protein ISS82_02395 [Nanoarchaeota archaeon]|nr:hypothetical protein [Nanoarchaeota archaeon]
MEHLEQESIEEKEPVIKRISIIIIAIFLIFLVTTYLLSNSIVRNISAGLIESEVVKNYQVNLNKTTKLIFTKEAYDNLMKIYDQNQGVEFKACLKGYINKNYYINNIEIPKTYSQKYNQVIAEPCDSESLVDMHSHPLKHCLPSETDFNSFESFKEKNPHAIMAVMCQRNRFNFYF